MNANHQILDILIKEMGAETILAICQQHISAKKPADVQTPVAKAVETKPEMKAPIKIVSSKVVIKKAAAPSSVAKDLTADLAAAASEGKKEPWVCPPCGKGPGNDHRPCVMETFNGDVGAWEIAMHLRPSPTTAVAEEPVKEKPRIVVKAKPKIEVPPPPEPEPEPKAEEKKVVKAKKVTADIPRCDARIYGEQVEMEGTKAPNGKPLHCFRPAQCERKGLETLAVPEEGEPRLLKEGESVAEDEGSFHLCKVCLKRWEGRGETPANWHGFFDDDGAPETSHFINGAWYQKKMAAAAKKQEGEEADD